MGIGRLEASGGLWINPCEAIHTFGMRIPIDVIFLDRNLRIKKTVPGLRPNRIAVCFSASSVLEIAAGQIASTGAISGDQLQKEISHRPVAEER